MIRARDGRNWQVLAQHTPMFDSLFDQVGNLHASPEVLQLRESIRGWRFYDHFRTDPDAPVRQPQLGTRTPVLHHDGRDLAAALQTILEIGKAEALHAAISDAFPGAKLAIDSELGGHFCIEFYQEGLLRPLSAAELSDGTLRYLLLVAALLTPRPPTMMVLNEPETSLHPDLLPALARPDYQCFAAHSGMGCVPCPPPDRSVAARPGMQLHRAGKKPRPDRSRRPTPAGSTRVVLARQIKTPTQCKPSAFSVKLRGFRTLAAQHLCIFEQ